MSNLQAQIHKLTRAFQKSHYTAVLFVTHDLRVAAQVCDTIAVTRLGKIVEIGPKGTLFENVKHEYTPDILSVVPREILAAG